MAFYKVSDATNTAVRATIHCLTGCAIGEIVGTVIGTALGWSNIDTELLTIPLAFASGYSLTMQPLLRHGLSLRRSTGLALASDTLSIISMEVMDTLIILLIPGALAAGLNNVLFWTSLLLSLVVAFIFTVPVNRYLINRGKGHAVLHNMH
jgi:hypothetical protein